MAQELTEFEKWFVNWWGKWPRDTREAQNQYNRLALKKFSPLCKEITPFLGGSNFTLWGSCDKELPCPDHTKEEVASGEG